MLQYIVVHGAVHYKVLYITVQYCTIQYCHMYLFVLFRLRETGCAGARTTGMPTSSVWGYFNAVVLHMPTLE